MRIVINTDDESVMFEQKSNEQEKELQYCKVTMLAHGGMNGAQESNEKMRGKVYAYSGEMRKDAEKIDAENRMREKILRTADENRKKERQKAEFENLENLVARVFRESAVDFISAFKKECEEMEKAESAGKPEPEETTIKPNLSPEEIDAECKAHRKRIMESLAALKKLEKITENSDK